MGLFTKIGDNINNKVDEMKQEREEKAAYFAQNDELVKSFTKQGTAGGSHYNDSEQIILLKPVPFGKTYAVRYETIKSVRVEEKIEDVTVSKNKSKGEEKRKGVLTRAAVGTVLMPGIGTVIGAATAKKKKTGKNDTTTTTRQKVERTIIITRDDKFVDTITMPFSDSLLNKVQSILQNTEKNNGELTESDMNHLLKLKSLLDAGILTQEEFDIKKEQFMK
ncbi:SHOCT domain-containing protein [Lactococcus garvieae]|uniref:SHOCT domain-containing protein n=1 Tax=Lactococcus garvieae TaxID=1363 RepID=UPI00115387E3|nr:SHOCT domain-containing protein [Lactococcus garvieae]